MSLPMQHKCLVGHMLGKFLFGHRIKSFATNICRTSDHPAHQRQLGSAQD
jgi:hypothetical protein